MDNQELTKKEQYLLKKQKKLEERNKSARDEKNKSRIKLILMGLIFVGTSYVLANNFSQNNQGTPKIEIAPLKYDAGVASMADGLVETTFEIKNTGNSDLKITEIKTSCMCTTAVFEVDGRSSPEFGMHSAQLPWSQKIAPGQTGYLDVAFDPAYHSPNGTGDITRIIYISSNDPQNRKIEAKLMVNVIP